MSRIQSALVGSVKPIRNDAGYDITEATIGMKAQELGLETSVRNLNQMEKRILRIIVLMDQMRNTGAMQDLARTIEQPANQIKVLKQQVQELGVWLGNVFIGTIGSILPYINGFIMALVAIAKTLAIFVGFKNTGKGATEALAEDMNTASIGAGGVASGLGKAAKSAKEIKKTLMGFDVLNVIQKPTESSPSSGGGGGGGGASLGSIDPKILNALKDYDNLMDKIRMKATEIRDKIMDWLGFTKVINPLTGEISWKLKEGATRFKTILNILKTLVALILGIKILGKLRNLITLLKTGAATGLKPFSSGLVGITNVLKGTGTWLKIGVDNFKSLRSVLDENGKHVYKVGAAFKETAKGMWDLIPAAVKATAGIAGLAVSLYGAYDSMSDFSSGIKTAREAFTELGISIGGAAASGALLGSVIPGVGTAVGAVIGVLLGATTAVLGYKTENDKLVDSINESNKEIGTYIEQWDAMKEAVQNTIDTQLAEVGYTENLVRELDDLVDANGKVKTGYEERVKFILNQLNEAYGTEYELINGEIKNYKDLKDTIYETINAKKAEILLEANQAVYAQAIQERTTAYNKYQEAIKNTEKSQNALKDSLEMYGLTLDDYINKTGTYESVTNRFNVSFEKLGKAYDESKSKLEGAKRVWEDTNNTIISWEDLKTATITGDAEQIQKKTEEITRTYETESGKQVQTLKEKLIMEKEATETFGKDTYSIAVKYLADTTKGIQELSDEQIEAWKYLAEKDREAYNKALDGLDEGARKLVVKTTNKIISETDNALPGVKKSVGNIRSSMNELSAEFTSNPKVTIDPRVELNTYNLRSKLNSLNSTLNSSVSNGVISRNYTDNLGKLSTNLRNISSYASGGLPNLGELFVAREAGPELVGSIGNKNVVMNNQQIVDAVSSGVAKAVSSVLGNNGSSYALYIDGEQITDVVQRRIARQANITGMAMGV